MRRGTVQNSADGRPAAGRLGAIAPRIGAPNRRNAALRPATLARRDVPLSPAACTLGAAAALALGAALGACGRDDRGDGEIGVSAAIRRAHARAATPRRPPPTSARWRPRTPSGSRLRAARRSAPPPRARSTPAPSSGRPPSRSPIRATGTPRSPRSVLMAPPLRAPLLLTDQGELPGDTRGRARAPRSRPERPSRAARRRSGWRRRADPGRRPAHRVDRRRRPVHARRRRRRVQRARSRGATAAASSSSPPTTRPSRCPPPPGRRSPATRSCSPRAARSPARRVARCARTASRGSTCSGRARPSRARSSVSSASSARSRESPAAARRRRRSRSRASSTGLRLGRRRPRARARVREPRPPAGRRRRRAALGERELRPAAAHRRRRRAAASRCATTCTTSSPGYSQRPGARGLQSRLDHRRRADDLAPRTQARIDSLLEIAADPTDSTAVTVSQAEHPDRLRRGPRVTVEDVRAADGRLHAAFRAADAQPHRAADRATCRPTIPRASRASARSRGSTRSASPASMRGHRAEQGLGAAGLGLGPGVPRSTLAR